MLGRGGGKGGGEGGGRGGGGGGGGGRERGGEGGLTSCSQSHFGRPHGRQRWTYHAVGKEETRYPFTIV